ncbi:MAG: Nif3-like dinuclear metal center hexameric protein [Planctomycetes bacterium]|nr:Nif3-like dinuclear metal center hexameric protein [Planctomycetota bacterium]
MVAKRPDFAEVLDLLQEIAPLELAAEWDNVGMILQPRPLRGAVGRLLLTIDLTEAVVREAVAQRADLVVSYHPPLFKPCQKLRHDDPRQRAVLAAIAAKLPVWSPHTALDAAPGGMADWLAEGLAARLPVAALRPCGDGEGGRFVELGKPVALAEMIRRCKRRFGVRSLRLARAVGGTDRIRTFAVAVGAGAALLRGERVDLQVTGEMSHHDVLAATAGGAHVLLAEHSASERGYLRPLAARIRNAFAGGLTVAVAKADRDPLVAV